MGWRTHSQQFEFADGVGVSDLGRAGPWWFVHSPPLYRLRDGEFDERGWRLECRRLKIS